MAPDAILLVEDDPDDVDLAREAFRRLRHAHQLLVASDGAAALALAEARAAELAFVLLDLKLPGLDGLEVLRRLRASPATALLPVIVMTSSVEERDVGRAYACRASSYVRKPIDFEEFVGLVDHLAEYWLAVNLRPSHGARR